jgi:HSP20 family protein
MPTSMIVWSPFGELDDLKSEMDQMFAELAREPRTQRGDERAWAPAGEVHRDDGRLIARAQVPGFKPEEIKIEFEVDTLSLCG